MGYHIILEVKCQVLPEYIDFIKNQYMREDDEDEENTINPLYEEFLEIWKQLEIGDYFYNYHLEGDIFTFRIEKKPHRHKKGSDISYGNLEEDYMRLLHEIIVPITRNIIECMIEHDDFGLEPTYYKDGELRGKVRHIATCPNCRTKIYK